LFPNIEEQYYRHFIRGLFDGDGSVSVKTCNNVVKINLISTIEIINFIQSYLLKNLDIKPLVINKVTPNRKNVFKMYLYKDAKNFYISYMTTVPFIWIENINCIRRVKNVSNNFFRL